MIESGTKQKMAAICHAASLLVTAEELDAFVGPGDMDKPEYAALKRLLAEFSKECGVQFTFFMRLDPHTKKMQFIIDNVLDPAEQPDGLDSAQVAREPGPDLALAGQANVVDFGSYSEGWDGLITAWRPMYYADGRISNMVAGVDMQDVFIKRTRANAELMASVFLAALAAVILLGFACLFIYRRKARQAQLANEAKSSFLSRMSHKMPTPLNAIMGLSDMALESADPDDVKRHLANIQSSSRHLRNLIDDILDLAKIESGKMRFEPALVTLENECAVIRDIIMPQAGARRQRFSIETDPAIPPRLYCDAVHLRQVIVNLLSNALKFTPENGEIRLSANLLERDGMRCKLEWRVSDTGIGLAPDMNDSVFKPFEQVDNSITRKYGGTGLGLSISRQLVALMQGSVRVESEPGKGSDFIFTMWTRAADGQPASGQSGFEAQGPEEARGTETSGLRKAAPQGSTPEAPESGSGASPEAGGIDLGGKTLLLVEDTEINRMIAVALFEKYGATVDTAGNGREGYDAFMAAPERYAMIFMDIQMPVMDGYTSAQKIRESGGPGAVVPIVAMTANVFKEDVDRALAAGMNAHLKKPLEVETIEATIARLLPETARTARGR